MTTDVHNPPSWMFDADGELMPPDLDLEREMRLTEDQWQHWWAVWDAHTNSRQAGRNGVKLIGGDGDPEDPRWIAVVDALIERDLLEVDRPTALRASWIKYVGCPGCGSSGAFVRRDKATSGAITYPAGQVRVSCGRRCRTRDVLAQLGIETVPEPTVIEWNPAAVDPVSLEECHAVFRRWLGDEYDLDALDGVLATAAAERLGGDPLWLLLISGSGNAKTETVQALGGAGAHVTSTISSEGALLSATPKREKAKNATGGLLRQLGESGILVVKDVTSILSMDRNVRNSVLAAVREIHDGRWVRNVGTDGGRTLEWQGRLVIVGAVTTAWDRAHDVIAAMGDRFLLLRMDSSKGRLGAGRQSRRNVAHEDEMRTELAGAMAGVVAGANLDHCEVTDAEAERLLAAADLVTLARTGVDYDYRGDVIDAHAPEMPTRFMKQLVQVVRGGVAIGMDRRQALRLATRCARDSMPPLRLAILDDLAEHPNSTPTDVRRRLDKPRATVDRQLQALHILGVAGLDEIVSEGGKTTWHYSLAEGIDPATLRPLPDLLVGAVSGDKREGQTYRTPSHISGDTCRRCATPLTPGRAAVNTCCERCDAEIRGSQPPLAEEAS